MADLKISQLPTVTVLDVNDVLPIVDAGQTKQVSVQNLNNSLPITSFVQGASANWGAASYPIARMSITGPSGLTNTDNSTTYIVPFNTKDIETSPGVIEADLTNKNLILKQNGTYIIECRYASYDLFYAGAAVQGTLRARIRTSSSPITTTGSGTFFRQVGAGAVTTGTWNANPALIVDNGFAERSGTYVITVGSAPLYLAMTFQHTGGTAGGNTQAYPVLDNALGTQPYFQAKLIPT